MKVPRAAQIVLTILCVGIAAGFGSNSQFYSESLSSVFFAVALISVVIIQLRVCGLWPDGLVLIALTALLAIIDFRFLHYTPHFLAWFSFFGLSSLLLLALRAIWSEGDRRQLLVFAFFPALLFVTSEWFASNLLDLTERLHPKTLDLYLYFFDGSLGVQLPFLMGQAFDTWAYFKIAGELFYVGLPLAIALVYSGQLLRVRERAFPVMAAFLLTGPIGILFYNIFPAVGPIHLLRDGFPWRPLDVEILRRVVLEPVALGGPRNAIPSLHMAWVLLCWWYSRDLSWWERAITVLFLLFTFCATMGIGEHYFIDLIVAYPFALFMQALCSWPPAWKNRAQLSALLFGLLTVLMWFGALRYAPYFFWISPAIPWTACIATVGLTFVVKERFDRPRPSFPHTRPVQSPSKSPPSCGREYSADTAARNGRLHCS
jgi:PAP2 superfamily